VHCNDLDIEVLGTTFNVNARRGNTKVALITGKIKIDYTKHIVSNNKTLTMAPGDYVEYSGARLMLNKRIAKPVLIRSWTAAEISFTDAKLKEVVETLEDTYGYTVTVKDQALLNLKIEGEISVDKIADLLDVVATTLNLTITQPDNKHIVISK
jgi:ferric-dicitrate binding protein FerR (iron transport regulator)